MEASEKVKQKVSFPKAGLELQWVYGYHAQQCRNNVLYSAAGEIIYFVATVGIVLNVHQHTQKFFLGHSEEITSIAQNADKTIVATGQRGKEAFICIWSPTTMELLSVLKEAGHTSGIAALDFNERNQLVSVGIDEEPEVAAWNWQKGRIRGRFKETTRILFVKCAPVSHFDSIQFITCGFKHVKFWKLCGDVLEGKDGHYNKRGIHQTMLCAAFGSSRGITYTGSLGGDIYIWKDHILNSVIKDVHKGGVVTMHRSLDTNYVTGGKDGCIQLWTSEFKHISRIDLRNLQEKETGLVIRSVSCSRNGDKVLVGTHNSKILEVSTLDYNSVMCHVEGHSDTELLALATNPNNLTFVTGSGDAILRLWSITERKLLTQMTMMSSILSCDVSPCGSHVAVSQRNRSLTILNAVNLTETGYVPDMQECHRIVKYSPDGKLLAASSNDMPGRISIFNVSKGYACISKWETSSKATVLHLDWSADGHFIQTNDTANERHIYRIPDGLCVVDKSEVQVWATWTGILGAEVSGLWSKYTNHCTVTTTDVNAHVGLLFAGDEEGKISLHTFPSFVKGQKGQKLHVARHSSSVSKVRLSYTKQHLLSTGKCDYAIFQWRLTDGTSIADGKYNRVHEDEFSDDEDNKLECSSSEELDSDLEAELLMSYDRKITKEQIKLAHQKCLAVTDDWTGKGRRTAPTEGLQISAILGYRAYDCRNNLHFTQSGAIVYHVAAVSVVLHIDTRREKHYVQHTDDILCLALHPQKEIVATGQAGLDSAIHIWHSETMLTLSILKTDVQSGICAMDFSDDGKHIVSIGLNDKHHVVVWNWKKGEQIAKSWGHPYRILAVKWSPHESQKFATVGVKHFKFWTVYGNGFVCKNLGRRHDEPVMPTMVSVAFGKAPRYCFTGDNNGNVNIWDEHMLYRRVRVHDGPVFALHSSINGLLTGGKDGRIQLWDEYMERCIKIYQIDKTYVVGKGQIVQNQPAIKAFDFTHGKIIAGTINGEILSVDHLGCIQVVVQGHGQTKVQDFDTHPTRNVVVSLSDGGVLIQWDIDLLQMITFRKLNTSGSNCVAYSDNGQQVAVGFTNGIIQIRSGDTLDNIYEIHHRNKSISIMKFSPSNMLAVGLTEGAVDIFKVTQYKWTAVCHTQLTAQICHLDWSHDGDLLHINTADGKWHIFESMTGVRQNVSAEQVSWATWTSAYGLNCENIWTDMGCNISTACLSPDQKLLAIGDNNGFLRLLDFPIQIKHPKSKWYGGHGINEIGVKWSCNGRTLISTNGTDTAIVIWNRTSLLRDRKADYDSDESDSDCTDDVCNSHVSEEVEATTQCRMWIDCDQTPIHFSNQDNDAVPKFQNDQRLSVYTKATKDDNKLSHLELEYVIGYNGNGCRSNIHAINDGQEIVYASSSIGVVMNTTTGNQSFYTEHSDVITCLVANEHPQFRGIVASGQVRGNPAIAVWSSTTLQTLSLLRTDHDDGIGCIDFSSSGKLLVNTTLDADHTVTVHSWQEGCLVARAKGSRTTVFSVKFRPDDDLRFVTVGQRHIAFWRIVGSQLVARKAIMNFNEDSQSQISGTKTMLSITFGKNDVTYTGATNGSIYIWKSHFLHRIIVRAHTGPIYSMHLTLADGLITTGSEQNTGAHLEEACIKLWDPEMKRCRPFLIKSHDGHLIVKSVTRCKGKIIVGSSNNTIYEIMEKTNYVHELHQSHGKGGVWGLTLHPHLSIMATTGGDRTLRIWDLFNKRLKNRLSLESEGLAVHFSGDGDILAVGQQDGQFLLVNTSNLKILSKRRDAEHAIIDLKISPCKKLIATANNKSQVNLYCITQGLQPILTGYWKGINYHSVAIDFSIDSNYLMVTNAQMQKVVLSTPQGFLLLNPPEINYNNFATLSLFPVPNDNPNNMEEKEIILFEVESTLCSAISHKRDFIIQANNKREIKSYACHNNTFQNHFTIVCLTPHYFISRIGFGYDDKHIVTTGGYDSTISVWRIKHAKLQEA